MKLFFIALFDILQYLKKDGTKKEWKTFLYAFNQIMFVTLFGTITAPIFWPIYYVYRFKFYRKLNLVFAEYEYSSPEFLKKRIKESLNWWERFIYLYGDKYSPTCEKLPAFFMDKHKDKSWFQKYFIFSAIRNPCFNYHYLFMITKDEIQQESPIKLITDERIEKVIGSDGISPVRSGKHFFWRNDKQGNPYFCYRNNTEKQLFYLEYCGIEDLHKYPSLRCRLEISIRKI